VISGKNGRRFNLSKAASLLGFDNLWRSRNIEGYAKDRDRTALVNAKRPAVRLAEGSQPALDQRRIGQDPAVQGGVVHRQAALPE
jgi:hypothetical protein